MDVKYSIVLLFAVLLAATVSAYPAKNDDDKSTEVEFVPLEDRQSRHHGFSGFPGLDDSDESREYGDYPVVDTGYFAQNPIFFNPFGGFYQSIESMLARMRQRMADLLNIREQHSNGTGLFGQVDLSDGNTTSVTKVIDGHKVVINTTTYEKKGEHGGVSINVKTINFQPDEDTTGTEEPAETIKANEGTVRSTAAPPTISPTTIKEVESVEDSIDNEIFKNKDNENHLNQHQFLPTRVRDTEWDEEDYDYAAGVPFNNENELEDNYLDGFNEIHGNNVFDLTGDTYVNQILAEMGSPVNPNAEYIDDIETNHNAGEINDLRPNGDLTNSIVHDLTNDIYVNQILAGKNTPINPDAEFINGQKEIDQREKLGRPDEGVLPIDLSNDIYVNQILAGRNTPVNPDSEFINPDVEFVNTELNALKEFDQSQSLGQRENVLPIDLSNDIYVNQILADMGTPLNPNAEVFDVTQSRRNQRDEQIERRF